MADSPSPHRAGAVYHLQLRPGELPESVLVPGDPDRATRIAESWDAHETLRNNREYRSYRGTIAGVPVGVVSAGIGGPSMAITVEELARIGAKTVVRVGTCGAIAEGVRPADLVISVAAARFEGASRAYAPPGYPAVADVDVVQALRESARFRGFRHHLGVTATVDTFYLEQGRPAHAGYFPARLGRPLEELRELRIANIEMEAATLLTIARIHGIRAGAVCTVLGDESTGDPRPEDPGPAIQVANDAIVRLSGAPLRLEKGRTDLVQRRRPRR